MRNATLVPHAMSEIDTMTLFLSQMAMLGFSMSVSLGKVIVV
jgi:hypothetical protein